MIHLALWLVSSVIVFYFAVAAIAVFAALFRYVWPILLLLFIWIIVAR